MPSNFKAEDLKKSQKIDEKLKGKSKTKLKEGDETEKGTLNKKQESVVCESVEKCTKNKVGRNPITGEGCPEDKQKMSSRKRDGNPVLGTGYDIKTNKMNKMPVGGKSTILIT